MVLYNLWSNTTHYRMKYEAKEKFELFVLDLMVSCRARVFYAWGTSTYHRFVLWCRMRRAATTGQTLTTIINPRSKKNN